jgi:hypothetical protein
MTTLTSGRRVGALAGRSTRMPGRALFPHRTQRAASTASTPPMSGDLVSLPR